MVIHIDMMSFSDGPKDGPLSPQSGAKADRLHTEGGSCRGGFQTRPYGCRLPKQGGFETRPYKPPDLCAVSQKRDPLGTHGPRAPRRVPCYFGARFASNSTAASRTGSAPAA